MLWYVGRRLVASIPVFLGATLLIYAMVFLIPGDSVAALFGDRPSTRPSLRPIAARLPPRQAVHRPVPAVHAGRASPWTSATNFARAAGAGPDEAKTFPTTIRLALLASLFEAVLGMRVGVVAGLRRGGIFDCTVLVLSLVVIAIPVFVLGFVLQFLLGIQLQWFSPTVGAMRRSAS